ncbi:hypothetical protein BO71DRAFT_329713 [Aspergillus ellipticus CBS 707.79]|uniref:Uncharacterized protein n=1 Tax=Aspergillus ellipticus CBS 707.79 TaxID=1448320 RepID=A0A319D546_9EURO|nr:hypothetical protein BO71DRAFT_329713 [Aspergillus ellipticus CBS 707.79]
MVPKPSRASPRANLSRSVASASSSSSPLDPDMDRKVYIPLCFCLISFAVMVYIN